MQCATCGQTVDTGAAWTRHVRAKHAKFDAYIDGFALARGTMERYVDGFAMDKPLGRLVARMAKEPVYLYTHGNRLKLRWVVHLYCVGAAVLNFDRDGVEAVLRTHPQARERRPRVDAPYLFLTRLGRLKDVFEDAWFSVPDRPSSVLADTLRKTCEKHRIGTAGIHVLHAKNIPPPPVYIPARIPPLFPTIL